MKVQTLAQPVELDAAIAGASVPDDVIPGFARPSPDADREEWLAAFEDAYASARGDVAALPWGRDGADPALVRWLDGEAPGQLRPGASVCVVGCGAGDDAAELAARGYDVTAFDASPAAVRMAQERFAHVADCFFCADLLAAPGQCGRGVVLRRADLVVAVEMLSWLPPKLRAEAASSMARLVRPRGMLLTVESCREQQSSDTHDFPGIVAEELCELLTASGMSPSSKTEQLEDAGGRRRAVAIFRWA